MPILDLIKPDPPWCLWPGSGIAAHMKERRYEIMEDKNLGINELSSCATIVVSVLTILSVLFTPKAKLVVLALGITALLLVLISFKEKNSLKLAMIIVALILVITILLIAFQNGDEPPHPTDPPGTKSTPPVTETSVPTISPITEAPWETTAVTETTADIPYVLPGSTITLGRYEQDNDKNNGEEDIQWLVLRQEGDEMLVISVLGLDALPYARGKETSDWEHSSIRDWLNTTFYQTAFTAEERESIVKKEIVQDENASYPNTRQGNPTTDYVFLLSSREYEDYMKTSNNIDPELCYGTPSLYAVKKGAALYNDRYCWWWLRTSSKSNEIACTVTPYGVFDPNSSSIRSTSVMVRPAMWVKVSKKLTPAEP